MSIIHNIVPNNDNNNSVLEMVIEQNLFFLLEWPKHLVSLVFWRILTGEIIGHTNL